MRTLRSSLSALTALIVAAVAAAEGPRPQTVTLTTYDGVKIVGDYYAPKADARPAPMVILLHMYRSNRHAFAPLVGPLHEAGFAILAIDMRGHGESATPELEQRVRQRDTKVFEDMVQDVRAAYDFLAKRKEEVDRSRFALVGASVGCSVALRYAAKDRSVDCVVCLSPGLNYLGLDSRGDIARIRGRRILLISPESERKNSETLAKLAPGKDSVRVRIVPGRNHGTRMFGVIENIEYDVADFLKKGVGQSSDRKQWVYGSINSKVYHVAGCPWIQRIKPTNLRVYSSVEEARARGLREDRSKQKPKP